jgi:hypothetical protein
LPLPARWAAGAAGSEPLPFDFEGAFGFAEVAGADLPLCLAAAGSAPPEAAMLFRSASMMLTTLLGREGYSAALAGIPACLSRMRPTTASS